jgi:hypothetical protein
LSGEQPLAGLSAWAARLGPWWYAIPSLAVILAGVATCSMIDTPEHDRFEVVGSIATPGNARAAVVTRQRHADSGATVACVFLVVGAPPGSGPTRRLTETCALVATDADTPLVMRWLANGKLGVKTPVGFSAQASEPLADTCYFERGARRLCYRPQLVQIEP